jgi:hypothetical protein
MRLTNGAEVLDLKKFTDIIPFAKTIGTNPFKIAD